MDEDKLKVGKIKNGTVIDHIQAGKALDVYKILKGIEKQSLIIAINVPSTRMRRKDILKIENKQLESDEYNYVALISPTATVVSIKNYNVVKKQKITLPDRIKGIIRCKNPICISNHETYITPEFDVTSKDPIILKCTYCEHEQKI
ncbi:MAG: aspartate carbamoyltransferase regulatory subunit [archaeon]